MRVIEPLVRGLYGLLMTLAQPLLRRKLARRGQQEPGYLEAVPERFGHYQQAPEASSDLLWVHAVSLGETRTADLLLQALRLQYPKQRLLLTHGTATGRAAGSALLRPGDVQVWQPWDSPAAVRRFYEHFKPRLGLLLETEVWPQLAVQARQHGMPLAVVNGRLSAKSLGQALRLRALSAPAYAALRAVYAQTAADAERFSQLGAPVAGVFGNLKFDAAPHAAQCAQGQAWRAALGQPVLMFASSREGEEVLLLEVLKEIRAKSHASTAQAAIHSIANDTHSALPFKVLIVPRHPQRFDDVAALIIAQGWRVSRRSGWAAGPAEQAEAQQADIWLGDSLGEMVLYYSLSDAALLGGSFAPLGGQNLIEAAACGCPVVMGPHTFNFTEAASMAEAEGAALRAADMADAVQASMALLADAPAQAHAAAAGLAFAARHRGATERTLQALRPWLGSLS